MVKNKQIKDNNKLIKNIEKDLKNIIKRIETIEIYINSKQKNRKKDPNQPKGIKTAYMFYKDEKISELKKENPEKKIDIIELTKNISTDWNNIKLNPNLFDKYKNLQEKDKKRYKEEMNKYNTNK